MAYDGRWNATDQIPQRALNSGLVSRYGSLDTSDGGTSHRYSLSAEWQKTAEHSITKANAYLFESALNLFSNFTYFLNDPINGDQFAQTDKRVVSGLRMSQEWLGKFADHDIANTIGLQARNDAISKVALYNTKERQILSVTSEAEVAQTSVGVYFQNRFKWANYYTPTEWFTLDADFAFAHARFTDLDPSGNRIPGSPEGVIAMGASIDNLSGFLGSVRLRYFGPRPLIEDNSERSKSATLINARIGYEFFKNWRVTLDIFNLFDSKESDIDYFYTSRLPGEPSEGIADIHTHPANPREARVTLTATF